MFVNQVLEFIISRKSKIINSKLDSLCFYSSNFFDFASVSKKLGWSFLKKRKQFSNHNHVT